jgi:hypothetical protein
VNMIRSPWFLSLTAASTLLALSGCDDGAGAGAEPPPASPYEESTSTGGTEPAGDDFGQPQEPAPGDPAGGTPADPAAPPPGGAGDPTAPQGDAGDISPTELETFSVIQLELMELQQNLQQRAQAGEDPKSLQQELDRRALELVEESELSVQRFETIARQAQADPGLRQRIESTMREQVGS